MKLKEKFEHVGSQLIGAAITALPFAAAAAATAETFGDAYLIAGGLQH